MGLKRQLLERADSRTLKAMIDGTGVEADRRSPASMREALAASRASACDLAVFVTDEQLAAVGRPPERRAARQRATQDLPRAPKGSFTTAERDDRFVAIDFETADYGRDSACSVALVRVEGGQIAARVHRLIRPPRRDFVFTYLHGISWKDVKDQPTFATVWSELAPFARGARFLAAHNASFDRSVLHACCQSSGLTVPSLPFVCTVHLARRVWGLRTNTLDAVCRHLGIPLEHHRALSDAEACARILLHARRAQPSIVASLG